VLSGLGSWIAAWDGTLAPRYAALASTIVAGLYAVSRGIAKAGALTAQPTVTTQPAPPTPPPPAAPTQV